MASQQAASLGLLLFDQGRVMLLGSADCVPQADLQALQLCGVEAAGSCVVCQHAASLQCQ